MTATMTELELVELILPDDEPGCEFQESPCSVAATWRGIKACGHHRLACEHHHAIWTSDRFAWSYCADCRATLVPSFVHWHRI